MTSPAPAKFAKAICPECQRVISGRIFGITFSPPPKVELLRHKTPWGSPCNGTRRVVTAMGEAS